MVIVVGAHGDGKRRHLVLSACIAGRSGRSYEAPTRLCPPLQKHPNVGMEGFDVSLPHGF